MASWQRDECPPWCAVRHGHDDHPDDWAHVSAQVAVPVVARVGTVSGEGESHDLVDARELAGVLRQRDGAPDVWLYVGDGAEQWLELTVESWARVLPFAAERLGQVHDV